MSDDRINRDTAEDQGSDGEGIALPEPSHLRDGSPCHSVASDPDNGTHATGLAFDDPFDRADLFREIAWAMARAQGFERPGPLTLARCLDELAREVDRERDLIVSDNAHQFSFEHIARVMNVSKSTAHRMWGKR